MPHGHDGTPGPETMAREAVRLQLLQLLGAVLVMLGAHLLALGQLVRQTLLLPAICLLVPGMLALLMPAWTCRKSSWSKTPPER